jgi:hypothetical protein
MKKYALFLVITLIVMAACVIYVPVDERGSPYRDDYYDDPYSSGMDTSYFYEYLSPHGVWIHHPPYGYVWIPERMGYGWRPYTRGQWVWSDFGWTWASDFGWGWIPFHYGRWGWERYLGWYWVPGAEWGPAWVSWRTTDLYIGWAPIPPEARFVPGVGITALPFALPHSSWVFVQYPYFLENGLHRYVLPMERNLTIVNRSALKTDIRTRGDMVINRGVDIDYVRRMTRRTISRHQLAPADRPGQSRIRDGRVEIYNPIIEYNESARPEKVLERGEALDRITRTTIREPEGQEELRQERLKNVQEQEIKKMEDSQQKELIQVLRKKEQEESSAKDPAEKQRIKKEYDQKVSKIKETHEKEKTEIKKRHEKEEEQTKKIKKKIIKK